MSRLEGFSPLLPEFFHRPDVTEIASDLIGKILVSQIGGTPTAGIIVETEAYAGTGDRACHANNKKRTPRTETMFLEGGHAYVYLCYGMHHLFNVVTNVQGEPDAVLVRALQPIEGIEVMAQRRKISGRPFKISRGPACLSQAMGINKSHNAIHLVSSGIITIGNSPVWNQPFEIQSSTRIGVEYAGSDAEKPWRYFAKDNPWVSHIPVR